MICDLGFPKVGSLTPEARLQQHENTPHRSRCAECGMDFVSNAHVKFHLRYAHDNKCQHCHSYCDSSCSEYYGLAKESAGSKEMEEGRKEKNKAVEDTEIGLEKLVEELTTEHLDTVQNFAATIDIGYEDFEAEKWCRLIYFPSPTMPRRSLSSSLYWWIYMDTYEASLDTLTMDIKRLEIERCAYMGCGFTFIDIHSHY